MTETGWERYGLIAHIAQALTDTNLGKTKLQKLVFLIQQLADLPPLYRFHFYTYGPYSSSLSGDASYMQAVQGLRILQYPGGNAYEIKPGDDADAFLREAEPFLASHRSAIGRILDQFGHKSAQDLELIATLVYVTHYDPSWQPGDRDHLIRKLRELKPKFSEAVVGAAIDELAGLGYVPAAATTH
jgi:uncharacterized protein YwgA